MKFIETEIGGLYQIKSFSAEDIRGIFCKTFNSREFDRHNIKFDFQESFYSISKRNVIRGMHFQLPPYAHDKLVYVVSGSVMDIVLDLRKESETYKKYLEFELSIINKDVLFIPSGCAHGFKSLEDNTIMVYNTSTIHSPDHDSGIRWDSFGYDWKLMNPIISEKDSKLIKLKDFKTPF